MDTDKLQRMNRRKYLKTLGALGVSATSLRFLSKETLAQTTDNPEDEVPYVAYYRTVDKQPGQPPKRKPVYETIPRDEWVRRHTAINVRDKLADQLRKEGIEASASYTGMDQSPTGFGVKIRYPIHIDAKGNRHTPEISVEQLESRLPSRMTGVAGKNKFEEKRENIPVVVEGVVERDVCTYDYDHDWDYYPGGAAVDVDIGSSTNLGSTAGSYHHPSYGDGLITAGHVVDSSGNEIWRAGTADDIGTGRDVTYGTTINDIDYAFIEMDDDENPSSYVVNSDNTSKKYPIRGTVSNQALENHVDDSSWTVYTQGRSTCRSSGYVKDTVGLWGATDAVITSQDVDPGDSGGTLFRVNNGDAYICGNIIQEVNSGTDAKSTTAETLEDHMGGYYY